MTPLSRVSYLICRYSTWRQYNVGLAEPHIIPKQVVPTFSDTSHSFMKGIARRAENLDQDGETSVRSAPRADQNLQTFQTRLSLIIRYSATSYLAGDRASSFINIPEFEDQGVRDPTEGVQNLFSLSAWPPPPLVGRLSKVSWQPLICSASNDNFSRLFISGQLVQKTLGCASVEQVMCHQIRESGRRHYIQMERVTRHQGI